MRGRILSVQVGRVAPFGNTESAFVKTAVPGPVEVGRLGLAGDAQANRRVHGGPEKAVYVYCAERYAQWRERFPQHAALLVPGGLGENLTVAGLDEEAVCVDDVFAAGSVVLQVSEPRIPCHKMALRFGDPAVGRTMGETGWRGFYCRVLQPGTLAAGDAFARLAHHGGAPVRGVKAGRLAGRLADMTG